MPIYEYQAKDNSKSCEYCAAPFEVIQRISDERIAECPKCGASVSRIISAPSVGASKTSFDNRAKQSGFHKYKKLGKGEYEKQY